jgi:hypothetical protein
VRPLPRSIARWADQLAAFSPEAHELLGPWLPILERLRGAVSLPHAHADGEPDGFSGLGRRGLYYRLVATEWALLDDVPDEFVRRAGAGEHLFHALARADAAGAGRIVVLFDAGPWQLGAPRLVHLAWLLVLARHARSRSVHLAWGVLQEPGAGLRESTDVGDIRALLAARSFDVVDATMVAAWADRLGPAARRDERWLVTHAPDQRTLSRLEAFALAVAETDDPPAASGLVLAATGSAGLRERAVLPIPSRRTCGQLLRDPFRGELADRSRPAQPSLLIAPDAQVVFAATSPHVLGRLESGGIVTLVPDRDIALTQAVSFETPPGRSVVAAGWRKGRMYVLTTDGVGLAIHSSRGHRWQAPRPVKLGEVTAPVVSPAVLSPLFVDRQGGMLWFCDQRWRLHAIDLIKLTVHNQGEPVVAWGVLARGVVAVQRVSDGALVLRNVTASDSVAVRLMHSRHRVSCGYVVASASNQEPWFIALGTGDGEWNLCAPPWHTVTRLKLAADTPVYGATVFQGRHCLLVRSPARERLEFIDGGAAPVGTVILPDEIEHACLHPDGHWIAAQVSRGVCVVNRHGQRYMRWGGRRS